MRPSSQRHSLSFPARGLLCILLFVAVGAIQTARAQVSGVYLGSTSDFVELVQIVKTPDGRLAGRIQSTSLNEKGEIETGSFSLEGAADGKQVILSAKSLLLQGDLSLSGFVDGELLDLSWPGGHRTYQRGDSYEYQAAVTGLEARALQLRANMAAENARSESATLAEILNALRSRLPDTQRHLVSAAAYYSDLYKKLRKQKRLANIFAPGSNLEYGADQKAYRIEQEIWRLDRDIDALYDKLGLEFGRANKLLASLQTYCAENGSVTAVNLCNEFDAQKNELSQLKTDFRAPFDKIDNTKRTAAAEVPPERGLLGEIFGN